MIITFTPYRISLFGGGTDFPRYYNRHGGACLSFTINKGIHTIIKPRNDNLYRVHYTESESPRPAHEIEHGIIREAIGMTNGPGVEIGTMGDIPAGSGLGSSSTVAVGVLHALSAMQGDKWSSQRLARGAVEIELKRLGKAGGVQDQFAAAYGGLRVYEWAMAGDNVSHRLDCPRLADKLLVIYTGATRQANSILKSQTANIEQKTAVLAMMKKQVSEAKKAIQQNRIDDIGLMLSDAWFMKKGLEPTITNRRIDDIFETAKRRGATGGKICGAGGAGYMMLFCPTQTIKKRVTDILSLPVLDYQMDTHGSRVIYQGG